MKFSMFIKDKIFNIGIILFALVTVEIFLIIYNFGTLVKIYTFVSILVAFFLGLLIEFYNKKNYYDELFAKLDELDKKYLIVELLKQADFIEANFLKIILQECNKSMLEDVNYYKHIQDEYKEYIELWIHEVKIPIATSKLIIENNRNSITSSIDEEIDKIDEYIEQALFYARSNSVEKDYIIRKINLREVVNTVIKKNKKQFISLKIKLDVKDIKREIYVDSKWVIFILNQIMSNSIKYLDKEEKNITIYSEENKENVVLYIKDNGLGIKESEVSRVFEKGFTGSNGRKNLKKSTGIGLYLSKKLCDKLGLAVSLTSSEGIGTTVKIIFPKNSYTNL